jgi:hypothetical protein
MKYLIAILCLFPGLAMGAPLVVNQPIDFDVKIPRTKADRPFLIANLRTIGHIPDGYYIVVTTKDHKSVGLAKNYGQDKPKSYIISLSQDMLTNISGEKHAYLQAVLKPEKDIQISNGPVDADITITVEE